MAKEKKTKTAPVADVPETDPRLITLVGAFLKDTGLASTAKIFEAETSSRKINKKKSTAIPTPASLSEALAAWEKSLLVKADADEDSGNESEDESSDSSDSSDDDSSDDDSSDDDSSDSDNEDDVEMKDDSSETITDDKKADRLVFATSYAGIELF